MKEAAYFEAIQAIIRTGHLITDQVSSELKEYDISEPQFNVLRILRGQKGNPITVQEIQDRMVQRSSNVTRIIDKLIAKGLVNRHECPSNRRRMDVTITDKGLRFLPRLDHKVASMHQSALQKMTTRELNTLTQLIKKLKEEIE